MKKPSLKKIRRYLGEIVEGNTNIAVVVGFVDYDHRGNLYNAAAAFEGSKPLLEQCIRLFCPHTTFLMKTDILSRLKKRRSNPLV